MADYMQLDVWQKAHQATLEVYRLTKSFPVDERFGLVSQMRRAAISIGANLAGGRGRRRDPEFARFLQIALGSAYELRYQWLVAKDVGYLSADDHKPVYDLLDEVCAIVVTYTADKKCEAYKGVRVEVRGC